jgi:hypothetical protein
MAEAWRLFLPAGMVRVLQEEPGFSSIEGIEMGIE